MMGLLGPFDIAAGGLALTLFNLLRATGAGLLTATGNLVAEAMGQEDAAQVRHLLRASLALGTVAALGAVLLLLYLERPLVWLGQDPALARRASQFLAILAPGLLPCFWFQSFRQFSIGLRHPGPLLAITVGCTALNGALDYLLIFGRWGFPKLGLLGIAWATSGVYLLSFFLFLGVVGRRTELSRYVSLALWNRGTAAWTADLAALSRTWRMGMVVAATIASETTFFTVLTLLIGTLGTAALAAQTIANQLIYIVFMISAGLSQSASVGISHACARSEFPKARRLAYTGLSMGLAAMLCVGVPYLVAPGLVLRPFLGNPTANAEVWKLAAQVLTIAALLQLFDCAQNMGVGILRGIGEVGRSFRMTLIGYWAIGLPTTFLLGIALHLGLFGIWVGLTLGLASTSVLLWLSFERQLAKLSAAG
ncbi:MAG: MATE family efflux transporter [Holophaga sp.]|nr:MATE family efflux transporter [Holophaga sp.]